MVKAIVGANWGDEGKGKITDMLAADSDIVIRFQGGANAGHTIINEYGKFALHLLPSGSFNQNVTNMIGNGVALDIPELIKEIDEVVKRGVPKPNIVVSELLLFVCVLVCVLTCVFCDEEVEALPFNSSSALSSSHASSTPADSYTFPINAAIINRF